MTDNNKIDSNTNPTEALAETAKTELTDDELSKVTGGGKSLAQNCAAGVHYTTATT